MRLLVLLLVLSDHLARTRGQSDQVESPGRRYPDRSDRYSSVYSSAVSTVRSVVEDLSDRAGEVARQANSQLPWNNQQQYPNSSISSRYEDAGAAFKDLIKQRDMIENPPPPTTTRRPETTTVRRPGIHTGGQTLKDKDRDPFDDPNRYINPSTQDITNNVRFANGLPYRETSNIKDRFGNRYDPRSHSIPGQYDPNNDPRFSDPNFLDPRNLPKYDTNLQHVPKDRYDTKYRYYERFPDQQRDKLRDPNYDPRWDTKEPHAPGVLGGWLPELQGECRPGCENLPRDVTVNTNYGRVNGFYVYLYDGPRVPLYAR